MASIVVLATMSIKADKEQEAMAALSAMAEATQAEAGCQTYALQRSEEDPRSVAFVERWASTEALDAHFEQPHMVEIFKRVPELLDGAPVITRYSPVPVGDPAKGTL